MSLDDVAKQYFAEDDKMLFLIAELKKTFEGMSADAGRAAAKLIAAYDSKYVAEEASDRVEEILNNLGFK